MTVHRWATLTPGQVAELGDAVQRHRFMRLQAGDITPGKSLTIDPGSEQLVIPSLPFYFQRNASSVLVPAINASAALVAPTPLVSAAGTVAGEPDGTNEPAGFSVEGEHTFSSVNEGGWNNLWDPTGAFDLVGGAGRVSFGEGLPLSGSLRPISLPKSNWSSPEFYFRFDLKVSSNWQGHSSSVNKIFYVTGGASAGGDPLFLLLNGIDTGGLTFAVQRQNANISPSQVAYRWNTAGNEISPSFGDAEVVRDAWTTIEAHVIANTPGSANGEVHGWVDGTKILQFTGVTIYAPGDSGLFSNIRWEPIWGGSGDVVEEDMSMFMDNWRLSTP